MKCIYVCYCDLCITLMTNIDMLYGGNSVLHNLVPLDSPPCSTHSLVYLAPSMTLTKVLLYAYMDFAVVLIPVF